MHHDVILEIGEGSYTHLLDKDTRILEGRSHFAIPAFIETDAVYPACDEWNKTRKLQEYRMQYMQHGVLTMAMDSHAQSFLEMDIVPKQALTYPILYGNAIIKASTKYTKNGFVLVPEITISSCRIHYCWHSCYISSRAWMPYCF